MNTLNTIINTCELTRGNLGPVAYYSHLIPIFLSLILGIFVFIKAKYNLFSKIFLLFVATFSLWLIGDLVGWTQNNYFLQYASWSPLDFLEIIFYILGLYFVLVFTNQKDISKFKKSLLILLVIPAFFITITNQSVIGFNYPVCEAFGSSFLGIYKLVIEGILLIVMVYCMISPFIKKLSWQKKRTNLIMIGSMFLFLAIFGGTEYVSSLTGIYEYTLYSLFLLPIFLVVIIYAVFELDIFHFNIIGTQYLVVGLVILMTGQLFFVNGSADRLLTIITVILTVGLSIILFRNLKRESDQRVRIEKLSVELEQSKGRLEESNLKLEGANEKLKGLDKLKTEFVSLASHQLRSPLTAIKGYASMLMDGDYGEMSKEAKEAIDRMYQSSKNLTIVVEDLLNVTKIESGGMKFEMAPFDLSAVIEDEAKDFSMAAEKKGLKLNFEKDNNASFMVNGDKEKIRQIVINFIDNSVKYTKEGNINVSVKNKDNKVVFCVKDTGMGTTEEVKESLFQKFARGDGARMNTTGSGLGLYLAKQIVEAHKGRVWVESDGEGKGSAFFMELDAIK